MPEILDDLWHAEQVLEKGDEVSGITDRKIKGKDENQKSERATVFVTIQVETAQFHEYSEVLKINGIVVFAKPQELVPLKSHQSIDFELGKEIKIKKKEWHDYQIDRLKRAERATNQQATLLVVLDDENATFGWLKEFDLVPAGNLTGKRKGKRFAEKEDHAVEYFNEIIQKTKELKPARIVIAGPGFTKDEFKKHLKDTNTKLGQSVSYETTNSVGVTGLMELIQSDALEKLVQQTQYLQDAKLVERFLTELGKQTGLAEYGFAGVKDAVERGAVSELLIVDSELMGKQTQIEPLMKTAESTSAKVHILHHHSDAGKKIKGFGGIVAILRYVTR